MMKITLRELPVEIDVALMAEGMVAMFSEDEKAILRFGLLPAETMEVLKTELQRKFAKLGSPIYETDDDIRLSRVQGEFHEWRLSSLVSEAMREITLGIYAIGELVV